MQEEFWKSVSTCHDKFRRFVLQVSSLSCQCAVSLRLASDARFSWIPLRRHLLYSTSTIRVIMHHHLESYPVVPTWHKCVHSDMSVPLRLASCHVSGYTAYVLLCFSTFAVQTWYRHHDVCTLHWHMHWHIHTVYIHVHTLYMGATYCMHIPLLSLYMPLPTRLYSLWHMYLCYHTGINRCVQTWNWDIPPIYPVRMAVETSG
jgi:hypothetical protein